MKEEEENSIDAIATLIAVLKSGRSVVLPATGYSMFPTLRPGDRVTVKPLTKGALPEPGVVVVYVDKGVMAQRRKDINHLRQGFVGQRSQGYNGVTAERSNGNLVMHRLAGISNEEDGNVMVITRGDSMMGNDKPWPLQHLIGVAVSFKRHKKEHTVKNQVLSRWNFRSNHLALWFYFLVNNFKQKFRVVKSEFDIHQKTKK